MPEGQFSGPRGRYVYTSDSGQQYILTLDVTLAAVTGTGLSVAAPGGTIPPPPKKFKPRIVWWQGVLSGKVVRKRVVCNRPSPLYETPGASAIAIDGVDGRTTGRVGERLTY